MNGVPKGICVDSLEIEQAVLIMPLIPEDDKPDVSSFQTTFVNDVSVDTTTSDFDLSQSDYLPEYE
ncbi:hypothetical protein BELL_0125g00080 [Botrytis elliptica]|uniref:Uncharacterized protein n=1 Tax=Botrytis elliptica TaxID=278938 RepID=A0A4Z1JTC0_9HELO|nr:hypothetical protein BELL_0125g00080 [Botrytis elliptica]